MVTHALRGYGPYVRRLCTWSVLWDRFCICVPSGHWSAGHSLWWGIRILFFRADQGQYCRHERRNWEDCISLRHQDVMGFVCFRSRLSPSKFELMALFTVPTFRLLLLRCCMDYIWLWFLGALWFCFAYFAIGWTSSFVPFALGTLQFCFCTLESAMCVYSSLFAAFSPRSSWYTLGASNGMCFDRVFDLASAWFGLVHRPNGGVVFPFDPGGYL